MAIRYRTCDKSYSLPHDRLCKIKYDDSSDLLRHIEQIWDEIEKLKNIVDKLNKMIILLKYDK